MKLIVNADDFGISKGITLGIIEAHKMGIVTSTTLMCNMKDSEYAINIAKDNEKLGVGIHLVLTAGYPLSNDVKSLIDMDGKFLKYDKLEGSCNIDDIRKEFRCQMNKFLSFGLKPTHIDTHHHIHSMDKVFQVVKELALEYDLPLRLLDERPIENYEGIKRTEKFNGDFYDIPAIEVSGFKDLIGKYKDVEGVLELMCHPGYLDQYIIKNSAYSTQRTKELETLISDEVKKYLEINNIELINFREI